jgi:hypothetical protein
LVFTTHTPEEYLNKLPEVEDLTKIIKQIRRKRGELKFKLWRDGPDFVGLEKGTSWNDYDILWLDNAE